MQLYFDKAASLLASLGPEPVLARLTQVTTLTLQEVCCCSMAKSDQPSLRPHALEAR